MKKHQNKKIRIAIEYALKKGWVFSESGKSGHSFGQLKCPYNDSECRCGKYCQFGIWSTPRNPENHAKQIITRVDKCIHQQNDGGY